MKKKKKVIVAMSGGVDSSVSAALLKKNGYDVIAVFMRMHEHNNPNDARKVSKKLGIKFEVLDIRREFKKRVVDYLIKGYRKGNTPNPCVECNKYIKFKFLFDELNKLKADYIATGHYARIKNNKLLTAKDRKKDQTYFLWTLKQKQLSKILFPIGGYTKEQVRGLAKKFKLPVFEKRDSREICFIDTCIDDFLRKYIKTKKGPILTTDGRKVGEHDGLIFYTIGQRKGIKIGGIGPFYVVQKDFKKNALIVSNSEKDLLRKEMTARNVNWISGKSYSGKCKMKIRSMAKMVGATIKKNRIIFNKPQRAVTPGQSAVFYAPAVASAKEGKNSAVLGGGVIV
jgi:tRNA-specific 2-thiouridylase